MLSIRSQGKWVAELDRRLEQLRAQRLAARLRVSDEAFWWYIQEFGSATHAEQGSTGTAPRDGDGWYQINPVYAPLLVYEDEGGVQRRKRVWNPGTAAKHIVALTLEETKRDMAQSLAGLVWTGQINLAREKLISEVIKRALARIVEGMNVLEGTNPYGRLRGQSAADNFEQNAELVDVSG